VAVHIGINPLTWTNDDMPSLGADTPLETCLSEAKQAGYSGIELGNKFPRNAAELKPVMEAHGLDIVSGWYSASLLDRSVEEEIEAVQDHLSLLKDMGCKVMVFAETTNAVHGDMDAPLSTRPVMNDRQWQDWGEKLDRMGEYLEAQGVKLAYHHHMGTVVETEDEIDRLMEMTGPAVGLLFDTGHLAYAGGNPLSVAKRHAGRICHVHCKDIRRDVMEQSLTEDRPFLKAVLAGIFTVPGDGMIDYTPLFEMLRDSGYDGWLVVEAEQDPAKAHPLTFAKMGFEYLNRVTEDVNIAKAA
jgi:inosose dehydratase